MTPRPYHPFVLTLGMARLCDVLSSRAALADEGGPSFPLSFHFDPAADDGAAAASIDLEAGGFPWRLEFFDLDFLQAMNEAFAKTDILRLPEALRRAALLFFLRPFLTHLENALDAPIHALQVQGATQKASNGAFDEKVQVEPPLSFTLDLTGEYGLARRVPLRLRVASGSSAAWLAKRILAACPHVRKHPERSSWRFPVTLEAGTMRVPLDLLKSLAVADILIPPEYPAKDGHLKLILPGSDTGFCLDVSDGRAVVTDFYRNEETRVDAPEKPSALAALEVPIRFELEKKLMPLSEIEALAPGKTFPLGTNPLFAVTVSLHDQTLAQGRLVDLGGTLGVQITRLAKKPETKPEAS
jgi:type III secretion system YscQ/HrcQ family protein